MFLLFAADDLLLLPPPRDGYASLGYDAATNRITSPNFTYDAAGNQTITPAANPSGQQRYQYDAANRLVRVTDGSGGVIASYTYGATNQRLITEQGGQRTYYVAASGSVLAEYTEATSSTTPAWSQTYIYLGGRLLATLEPSGGTERVEYHHPDRLGTRLSTNQSDSSVQEQATLPFGTALGFETSGTSTSRRFTSYDRSTVTGLDYAVNRSYDPLQGRFTQVDPIDMDSVDLNDPQTLNLYAYCANDPVNCIDPDGLGIISFFKKLGKAIWKVLTSKVFLIAASIALAVISFGASAGWWALSSTVTQSVSLGSGITLSATTTQATALGWIAAGVSTALAIPALTSVSGILQRVASFGFGQALGGFGGAVGMGGTPDWNDDADEFAQRRGIGRRPPPRRGQRGYRGPGSWHAGIGYYRPPRRARPPVNFRGLVQNRPLGDLTHNDIWNAFQGTPFRPSSHAIMRLRDQRTHNLGIRTLNDYANSLNGGIMSGNVIMQPNGSLLITHGRFETIISTTGRIITIKPN